ncbi:anthranilate synthase component I family protein [Flavobacteriales bacterium AH-315-E23]|nr:anthranilate synthase component I family protein [Flavobacteriales bacterium AH-315-E23]
MYKLRTDHIKLLSDTHTPVSVYLKLRDKFPNSIMLESSDYHSNENSFSYICCDQLASISVDKNQLSNRYPDGSETTNNLDGSISVVEAVEEFKNAFEHEDIGFKFVTNGLFGYCSYDAVQYFEDIEIPNSSGDDEKSIPELYYAVYGYVIVLDHFKNELYIFQHSLEGEDVGEGIQLIRSLIENRDFASYTFESEKGEESNFTDESFKAIVTKGIQHCKRGDVFQVVLSREFKRNFKGDEFNVYRALRAVNPSPYLFYFDYGNFKLFGSSPEAQIVIKDGKAGIFPIAGTYPRTGNDQKDAEMAEQLKSDPKENSEHIMLVDLARNDLSRNARNVKVDTFSEIQYYSHVIHMVSKVTGEIGDTNNSFQIVADTFPAGTLSGAPKYRAMELINQYENSQRGFYGGAIGYMGFNGDFNHAIIIRSILSKNNKLIYQAGAGVVSDSDEEKELQEVNNKLGALNEAIERANTV